SIKIEIAVIGQVNTTVEDKEQELAVARFFLGIKFSTFIKAGNVRYAGELARDLVCFFSGVLNDFLASEIVCHRVQIKPSARISSFSDRSNQLGKRRAT